MVRPSEGLLKWGGAGQGGVGVRLQETDSDGQGGGVSLSLGAALPSSISAACHSSAHHPLSSSGPALPRSSAASPPSQLDRSSPLWS